MVRPVARSAKRMLPPVIVPSCRVKPVAAGGTRPSVVSLSPPSVPPSVLLSKTQFSRPSAARSRLIAGASAVSPVICTSPPRRAVKFTATDRLSARNKGASLSDHAAFAMLTGPVVTPRLGQSRGVTSPSSTILRPVIASNLADNAAATLSAGTMAKSPSDKSPRPASPSPPRMIQRMPASLLFLLWRKTKPQPPRLPSRAQRRGIKWPRVGRCRRATAGARTKPMVS